MSLNCLIALTINFYHVLKHHRVGKSISMYAERWLKAPMLHQDGSTARRTRSTPQGGAVSPLLATLFLHYVFDRWMTKAFPNTPFCRYADGGLVHCQSLKDSRFAERKLTAATIRRLQSRNVLAYLKDMLVTSRDAPSAPSLLPA